ncbi:hypothetical protein U1Q18_011810, partial [Sarracenia purpurea var. burkii]
SRFVFSCALVFLLSRPDFPIPAHSPVVTRIRSINRRIVSLSSSHIPATLLAEDATVEDTVARAASSRAGPSSSAAVQGESSQPRPLDLASLQSMLVAHIDEYRHDQDEY